MIYTVALLLVMFVAVTIGIFFNRWAVTCSMLVLLTAIASVIICWVPENQNIAFPSGAHSTAKDRG